MVPLYSSSPSSAINHELILLKSLICDTDATLEPGIPLEHLKNHFKCYYTYALMAIGMRFPLLTDCSASMIKI